MNNKIPSSTKVVIIGGGVAGASCAYHLAKFGWKDTILLERDQLTSGTTWHAAGLVSQLGPSAGVTKIRKYSLELYKKLEKEIDFSSGLKLNGALSIATTKGRWQELKRQATTAQLYDVNVEVLNIDQIKKIYPIINEKDVLGGIFMPGDGQADPIGVTNLLAKAARKEGAKIFEKSPVEKIIKKNGRVGGVVVNGQTIECEYIVLASGMWSRQIGEDSGFSIPLYPAEHFYVITEGINELLKNINFKTLDKVIQLLKKCIKSKNIIYSCGNGGSSSLADHFTCDFIKQTNNKTNLNVKSISLASNFALISAIANDISYDEIFSFQINKLCKKNDVLFLFSVSGSSKNLLNAVKEAKKKGVKTISFTGFNGGRLSKMTDLNINFPMANYGIVEDCHISIMHYLSQYLRNTKIKAKNLKKINF